MNNDCKLIARDGIGPGVYDLPLGDGSTAEFTYDEEGHEDGRKHFRFWGLRLTKDIAIATDPKQIFISEATHKWLEERLPERKEVCR